MNKEVFISYSRKDSDVANRICGAFDNAGISYFIDKQGLAGGFEFPTKHNHEHSSVMAKS